MWILLVSCSLTSDLKIQSQNLVGSIPTPIIGVINMVTKGLELRDAPNREVYRRRGLHKLMTLDEILGEFKIMKVKRIKKRK